MKYLCSICNTTEDNSQNLKKLSQIQSEISSCARILEEETGPENVHVNSVVKRLKELSEGVVENEKIINIVN